jgi:hypothetical protein
MYRSEIVRTPVARPEGTATWTSSLIEPEVENAAEESVRLRRTLLGLSLAADVIVVSEQRVRDWREVKGRVLRGLVLMRATERPTEIREEPCSPVVPQRRLNVRVASKKTASL